MMNHNVDSSLFPHVKMDEDMLIEDNEFPSMAMQYQEEEDELGEGMITPRAVHQCNVCNKIFVSFKGLQQHAVIHTDQKPFQCDICSKSFRFKSNLFEHRSVHTGFTPHACPYCGKTCRLKGNLKKHLRTHVTTKEELEAAWRPFASNRRPPADIPDDAIIVRGNGGPYYTPPSRIRKRKLGLGIDPRHWVDRIKRGELSPEMDLVEKIRRLEDNIFSNLSITSTNALFEVARSIAFEMYDCPVCKTSFMSSVDCITHYNMEHRINQTEPEFFCEKCLRIFNDTSEYQQHESYHLRVRSMLQGGNISNPDPQILVPTPEDLSLMFGEPILNNDHQHQMMIDSLGHNLV